ncbi:MAG: hypothetical protein OEW18_13425, partial [Candidatus Aminicenantes bacterium]|nr:hypothetical protein [Candidatus Aminicenantes bacterium]
MKNRLNGLIFALLLCFIATFGACRTTVQEDVCRLRFGVFFPTERSAEPLDGRMLLLISSDDSAEPRFQISDGPGTQLAFGLDVEGLKPGEAAVFDGTVFGYPLKSLAELPAGEYWVQALLNRYETFQLASGHTVKLPPDKGEGQRWSRKPGNLYSLPAKMILDP